MKFSSDQPKIIVIGSSSVDLILGTEHKPEPNETVLAEYSESYFGGKGANQAVAAARLGASVYFVGCVGMDPMGQQVMRNLVDEGVNVGFVYESEEADTGTAYIISSPTESSVIVVPAANYCLETQHIDEVSRYFETADFILIQLEVSMEVVNYTLKLAQKYGTKVGLYASPAQKLNRTIMEQSSFVVMKNSDTKNGFEDIASTEELLKSYPNKLFLREENNATIYFNGSEMIYRQHQDSNNPYKIGMGDAFTSGMALALCHGNSIDEAVKFGNEISSKVSKNKGSQKGLPYLKDYLK